MYTADQAKTIASFLVQTIEMEFQTTRKVLAAVPEDKLGFTLGEKGRTVRDLMWHTAASEAWFGDGVTSLKFTHGEGEPAAPATAAEIVAFYETQLPPLIEKAKAMSGEQLLQTVSFMGAFEFPAFVFMGWWINHTVHHRGQLSTHLRAMNLRVPSIYGGSADEPWSPPPK